MVGSGSGNEGITIFSGADSGSTLALKDSGADEDGFISYNVIFENLCVINIIRETNYMFRRI